MIKLIIIQNTCQKCKIQDKTEKILEAHHITLLCRGGKDTAENIITLCSNCHHYAPNRNQGFLEYMKEECEGSLTVLLKILKKNLEEKPSLFSKAQEEFNK